MPKRLKELERLKELAGKATENQLVTMINESANQIWLAGLGAFSKAQQEGGKKFEALVAEGEKVQERIKVAADERLAELREKASGSGRRRPLGSVLAQGRRGSGLDPIRAGSRKPRLGRGGLGGGTCRRRYETKLEHLVYSRSLSA
jgi:hypothetical protein